VAARSAPFISLDGTLDITLANSYIPPVGQSIVIITSLPFGVPIGPGMFANIEDQTFQREVWDMEYTQSTTTGAEVVLTAVPASVVPEPSLVLLTAFGLVGIVAWFREPTASYTLKLSGATAE
jgi:hypothetical protein